MTRTDPDDVTLIGHRGCAAQYPENTVGAIERAAPHVDAVEIDVRRCGSGEVVVVHDADLGRLTGASGSVADADYDELRDLTVETTQLPDGPIERAAEAEIEGLHEEFARYLRNANHPAEKRPKARRLLRRVLGRAHPTGREVRTLRGILRRGNGLLEHPERLRVDGSEREADER